jgi:hypothetical protein
VLGGMFNITTRIIRELEIDIVAEQRIARGIAPIVFASTDTAV